MYHHYDLKDISSKINGVLTMKKEEKPVGKLSSSTNRVGTENSSVSAYTKVSSVLINSLNMESTVLADGRS